MFISFVYIAWGLCCIEIVDKKNHYVREAIRVLGGGGGGGGGGRPIIPTAVCCP